MGCFHQRPKLASQGVFRICNPQRGVHYSQHTGRKSMAVLIDVARPARHVLTSLLRLAPRVFLALLAATPVLSAPLYSEESVKAAYLYRFTQYIEWPEEAASGPFTIAVLDAPDVAAELRRILPNHQINNSLAQVREISRVQDLGQAQMLYIGSAQIDRVRNVIAELAA